MSYTKGPWAWQRFGSYYSLTAQHGMREIIISANPDRENYGNPVVVMNNDGILNPIDPQHPNAKLIATAPELLQACTDLLTIYKKYANDDPGEDMTADFAEAAIKKATSK